MLWSRTEEVQLLKDIVSIVSDTETPQKAPVSTGSSDSLEGAPAPPDDGSDGEANATGVASADHDAPTTMPPAPPAAVSPDEADTQISVAMLMEDDGEEEVMPAHAQPGSTNTSYGSKTLPAVPAFESSEPKPEVPKPTTPVFDACKPELSKIQIPVLDSCEPKPANPVLDSCKPNACEVPTPPVPVFDSSEPKPEVSEPAGSQCPDSNEPAPSNPPEPRPLKDADAKQATWHQFVHRLTIHVYIACH